MVLHSFTHFLRVTETCKHRYNELAILLLFFLKLKSSLNHDLSPVFRVFYKSVIIRLNKLAAFS